MNAFGSQGDFKEKARYAVTYQININKALLIYQKISQ
jgi:hypothetical protein